MKITRRLLGHCATATAAAANPRSSTSRVRGQPPHRAAEVASVSALIEGLALSDAVRAVGLAVVSGCPALWLLSLDLRHHPTTVTGFNALVQMMVAQGRLNKGKCPDESDELVCVCKPRQLTNRLLGSTVLVWRAGVLGARREREGAPRQDLVLVARGCCRLIVLGGTVCSRQRE